MARNNRPVHFWAQASTPTDITTDGLRSYRAAAVELGVTARHERGLRQNNRAEVSHHPVRRRERKMRRFKARADVGGVGSAVRRGPLCADQVPVTKSAALHKQKPVARDPPCSTSPGSAKA